MGERFCPSEMNFLIVRTSQMGPVSQEAINLPQMLRISWFMNNREVPGGGLSIMCLFKNVCGCVAMYGLFRKWGLEWMTS